MMRQTKEILEAFTLAFLVFFLVHVSVQNFRVEGSSMSPTLDPGNYITVNKLPYMEFDIDRISRMIPMWSSDGAQVNPPFQSKQPKRGDIVVFPSPVAPEKHLVKRVIGLPGENVALKNGDTYINDVLMIEPYVKIEGWNETIDFGILGADHYFVMGDNRSQSGDSRHWGPVDIGDMIGTKFWDFNLRFKWNPFGNST